MGGKTPPGMVGHYGSLTVSLRAVIGRPTGIFYRQPLNSIGYELVMDKLFLDIHS